MNILHLDLRIDADVCGINILHADNEANILNYYAEILNRLDFVVKTLSEVY
jgi:hypothetical protein